MKLPPEVLGLVEGFKATFLSLERKARTGRRGEEDIREQVHFSCTSMTEQLGNLFERHREIEEVIGDYFFREAFPILMRSRFMERAFGKPLGYAGDYSTIEYLYDNVAHGEGELGEYIDSWALSRPAPQAVRNRRKILADLIQCMAQEWAILNPMPVTSLGSGPARELLDVLGGGSSPTNIHATCIDIDRSALSYSRERAQELGITDHFTFRRDSLIRICEGKGRTSLAPQQLIYSAGLIDYLNDQTVMSLIDWTFDNLLPGGTVVLGNFDLSNTDRVFMEYILEWPLNYRSGEELIALFQASKFPSESIQVTKDATGVQLFAICQKPLGSKVA